MTAHIGSLEGRPIPKPGDKWRRFVERRLPGIVLFLLVATLIAVVVLPYMLVTVPPGEIGVLWKRFGHGTVLDPRQLRGEGLHIIWPWDKLFLYDLRVQSLTETYSAISRDGVTLGAELNIRYRLQRNSIPTLQKAIGPDYIKLLSPQVASEMREVISEYTAEQVYSTARQEIQDKIRAKALERLGTKMMEGTSGDETYNIAMQDTIHLYDTLLYGITLPPLIVEAINRKTEQYYVAQEYEFRVEREKRESERKMVEAEGIREFQQIVSQGISDSYLRWRGVEATLQLAQSDNAKIVIIGGGKDGLPVILGNMDTPPPAHARGASPAEDRAGAARMTAAAPAVPLEKTPAAGLAMPAEKMPPLDSAGGIKPSAGPTTTSAAQPIEPRSLFPLSLSDVETALLRALRSAVTESPPKEASERPTAGQPR
jgi:regulator of protease activity HflC (stomatin/prohibitin superfamily)